MVRQMALKKEVVQRSGGRGYMGRNGALSGVGAVSIINSMNMLWGRVIMVSKDGVRIF